MFRWNFAVARCSAWILAASFVAPCMASAEMFAWRTDDGVFAYADDREKIPSRYAAAAVKVRSQRFNDYERLTVEDSGTAQAVTNRLRDRLAYLRAFNSTDARAAQAPAGAPTTLTVATGSPQAPTLDITSDANAAPIVVETVMGKGHGQLLTRSATIVKQGDRTLAVLKGRRNQHNLSTDIVDLDEAARGE